MELYVIAVASVAILLLVYILGVGGEKKEGFGYNPYTNCKPFYNFIRCYYPKGMKNIPPVPTNLPIDFYGEPQNPNDYLAGDDPKNLQTVHYWTASPNYPGY